MQAITPSKYQLVQIKDQEGKYFLVDVIESLWGRKAELKPVDSKKQGLLRVPIECLRPIPAPPRTPLDDFLRIVVQGLKPNIEQIQTTFHCNTIFKSYQFRPLLKYLGNPDRRILIADETGLGKTIEAGYILINEMSNALLRRVVILCPSSLQYKWQGELWHRFGLHFDIVSGRTLLNLILDKRKRFQCIASIDCIRSFGESNLANVSSENELDLLIIDEVHHMIGRGGEILRRRLGVALSLISKRVIGLTATPVHLEMIDLLRIFDVIAPGSISQQEFEIAVWVNSRLNRLYRILSRHPWNSEDAETFRKELKQFNEEIQNKGAPAHLTDLLQLLVKAEGTVSKVLNDKKERFKLRKEVRNRNTFSNLFTRTRRIEVGEERNRNIRNQSVPLDTNIFEAFQEGKIVRVSEKSLFEEVDEFLGSSFSAIHRRQLYSCFPAMIGLLRNGMRGFNVWVDDQCEELKASLTEENRKRCEYLANKFGLLLKDTKWEELKKTVRELHEHASARKVIVFTQWIPTIEYFRQKKQETWFPCYVISGQDSEQTRTNVAMTFQRHEGFCVLFTTDVMSEGLDLQSADCIINYDFPFNPQKIEQRIGRIDRIGQESKNLTIINMFVEEPLDKEIYEMLVKRLGIFEKIVGDLPDTLIEKIETGSALDRDEVIRALRENETRQRLLENDALLGVDEVLDDEIETINRTKHGVYNLRWMALERLMFLMLGEKQMQKTTVGNDSITFRELDEVDVDVLAMMVDIKDRADIKEELQGTITEDGTLKLAFSKDSDGLYLPYFHPLMQRAVDVSYQSLFGKTNLNDIKTETLSINGRLKGIEEGVKYLFLTEFDFKGKTINSRKWFLFSFDQENQELHELNRPILEDIWTAYKAGQVTLAPVTITVQLPRNIFKTIQQRYDIWVDEIRVKDTAQYLFKMKADIRRYNEKLNHLRLRCQNDTNPMQSEVKDADFAQIKQYMNRLIGVVAEMESNPDYHNGIYCNLRLVVVFKFEWN
jgi:superfamily II DNA or RNA helicase